MVPVTTNQKIIQKHPNPNDDQLVTGQLPFFKQLILSAIACDDLMLPNRRQANGHKPRFWVRSQWAQAVLPNGGLHEFEPAVL
jgi:hypothetical protein